MLAHPTLDQLRELNLDGMIKAINELEASDQVAELSHLEWLGLASNVKSAIDATKDWRCVYVTQNCATWHVSKTSTTTRPVAWIVPRSSSYRNVCGSRITKIYSFAENRASAKVG